MKEKEVTRMVKCPECPVELPAVARRAQSEHMERAHPEVFAQRLQELGLPQLERMLR